jgi:hypothetical protein
MKPLPNIEVLREMLTYCPESGELRWSKTAPHRWKGCIAGTPNFGGYIHIVLKGKHYYVARVCWALYYGEDPYPMEIDHINRMRADNRITNLRLATKSDNAKNRETPVASTGHRYISAYSRSNKVCYVVRINKRYIGVRDTLENALLLRDETLAACAS